MVQRSRAKSSATTVTETYKHLFSVSSDGYPDAHLGGKEVRAGETIQWNADWQQGAVTFSVDTTNGATADTSSKAHELFSVSNAPVYTREESWEGPYGTEYETTY